MKRRRKLLENGVRSRLFRLPALLQRMRPQLLRLPQLSALLQRMRPQLPRLSARRPARTLLLLPLALLLASCSSFPFAKREEAPARIALIAKSQQGVYWSTVRMGAEAAAKEFGVELQILAPAKKEEVSTASDQEALLQEVMLGPHPPQALVLAPIGYEDWKERAEQAVRDGIPVLTIDSPLNSSKVLSAIGTNQFAAGQKAAKKMLELTGKEARIAIIRFSREDRNATERKRGILDVLSKVPGVQIVEKSYEEADSATGAEKLTRRVMELYGQFDGILALNAIASTGVAAEIERQKLEGRVKIVTFDNTPEELELLQAGIIQATVIQNPFTMGYFGVKYAQEALNGKKVEESVDTGTYVIDLENMFWKENQKRLFPFVQ